MFAAKYSQSKIHLALRYFYLIKKVTFLTLTAFYIMKVHKDKIRSAPSSSLLN